MLPKGKIKCSCGACILTLNDSRPKYSLLCACEDCRLALSWASQFGGKPPDNLLYSIYLRSDFAEVTGLNSMRTTQLRDNARSTRIYCKKCYSCIGIDHINYANNVFMIQPDYCEQDFSTWIEPKAVIFLCDYPEKTVPLPSENIPIFHTFKYPQERQRFLDITPIGETLAPPKFPAVGKTIREIIATLNNTENLALQSGDELISC